MSEKSNEATPQRPEGGRVLDATMVTLDLDNLVRQIKAEEIWTKKGRNAITVYNTEGMSLVISALHKGAELKRHQAQGIVTVQVLEGRIKFVTDEKTVEMREGQMLALHEKIPHGVLALEESVFLLTHAKPLT